MSTLGNYTETLNAYVNATDDTKAGMGDAVKGAHATLTDEEKAANPLPIELAAAMGGRKSSRKSGGSRAGKRGGSRAGKRGGSRNSSRKQSSRGGSRSSRR